MWRRSFHIKTFCLILVLYPKERDGEGVGCLISAANSQSRNFLAGKIAKFPDYEGSTGSGSSGISEDDIPGLTRLVHGGKNDANGKRLLINFNESRPSLQIFAARVMEILDRISRNWAVEGAKTIQNGEIRLRKLYRDFSDKVTELMANESNHGQDILGCVNQTVFRMGLDKILSDTTNCYSKSLEAIQKLLRNVEEHENALLQKIEGYARKIYDTLSGCFVKNNSPDIVKCLQEVEGTDIGREMRRNEAVQLVTEIDGAIGDIPATFSECTTKGLAETEAHIRRGYAASLTCLKEK